MTKARSNATAPAAKGEIVVGTGSDASGILSVGSANQVLTVDSSTATGLKWAAPAASTKSYTLLNAGGTSLSGVSSVTISSLSGYNTLFITIEGASTVSGGMYVNARINNATTNYRYGYTFGAAYTAYNSGNYSAASSTGEIEIGAGGTDAAAQIRGNLIIDGCNSSGVKTFTYWSGAFPSTGNQQQINTGGGVYIGTEVVSSLVIRAAAGGNFDAGTVYVYGAN